MSNNVRITADFQNNASSQFKTLQKDADDTGSHVGKFGSVLQGIGLGIGSAMFSGVEDGFRELGSVMGDATSAFDDAQVSTAQLNTALLNNVPGYTAATVASSSFTAAMGANLASGGKLGFTYDEQRSSLALLVGVTHDADDAQTVLSAAQDLARLKGISLSDATNIMIKASEGQTRGLKAVGIEVPKNATMTQVLAEVTKVAGGQAEAFADTSAGKLAAAHVKVTEAMVKLGAITDQVSQAVLPLLADAFGNIMDAVVPVLDQIGTDLPPILAAAQTDIKNLVTALTPIIDAFLNALPGAISATQAAFNNVIVPVFNTLLSTAEQVAPMLLSVGQAMESFISPNIVPIVAGLGAAFTVSLVPGILASAAAAWAAAPAFAAQALAMAPMIAVVLVIAAAVAGLVYAWQHDFDGIQEKTQQVITAVTPILKSVGDFFSNTLAPAVSSFVKTAWTALQAAFQFFVTDVLPGLKTAFKIVSDFVSDTLAPVITNIVKTVWPPLKSIFDVMVSVGVPALQTAFGILSNTVIPAIGTAFTDVSTVVSTVWGAITGTIKTAMDVVIGAIDVLIAGIDAIQFHVKLPSITVPFVGTIGGESFDWSGVGLSQIQMLAAGGPINGWGIVGERGPELIRATGMVEPLNGRAIGGQGGGQTFNISFGSYVGSVDELAAMLARHIRLTATG